jgi:hypothetical protein
MGILMGILENFPRIFQRKCKKRFEKMALGENIAVRK